MWKEDLEGSCKCGSKKDQQMMDLQIENLKLQIHILHEENKKLKKSKWKSQIVTVFVIVAILWIIFV